ncbi:Disease resistance protein rph8a [Thalictrum thalictroides]|uniref:Disease resistance protein rph8a n=1 Tax=Thalictrum thalictroides TaxID=46969 RepID=A0A7J6X229_THATH|nr:Disease resistance protein rph8a [Thalictrum thalictroides]
MVEVWVRQIRDLAYDAEDVIDAFILHVEQQHNKNIIFKIIGCWSQLEDRRRIGKWIEQINRRTKDISACRSKYKLDVSESRQDSGHFTEDLARKRRSILTVEELDIMRFQKEATEVANRLIKENETQRQVICIIGTGGMGKSTLTRMIYNRADIKNHFEVHAWINVSQEYQVKDLLLSALHQVSWRNDESHSELTIEYLEGELQKHLQDKRYLVVIDDVWKTEAWDQIGASFPQNQKGSRIMLTTRNKDVASHASPSTNHHELQYLEESDSWELFCKKVFPSGTCPDELVDVAHEVVRKCNGLPLAIVVIGGLLIGKERTRDAWSKVLANVNLQDSNPCREILALSYTDLPYYLKSCFLYLGLFPEDFQIKANRLIRLWVAEGFVLARGEEKMEDVAEDYLEELIQRSMIQVLKRKYQGGPVGTCRVHDFWRDLAISEAKNDRFLDIHGKKYYSTSGMTRSRRLAIHSINTNQNVHHFNHKFRSLLIFYEDFEISKWRLEFEESTKMLRVLELEGVDLWGKNLPKEIGKLILLHYLGLRNTDLQRLPTSIGKLMKLQTLDIRGTRVGSVPKAIWKMQQLRHLFLITSGLMEFQKVHVSREDLPRDLLTLHLPSFIWMDMGEGLANYFVEFDCLRSLRLYEKLALGNDSLKSCLPSSLTELNLKLCQLEHDPSAVLGSLPKLRELRLGASSYVGREMVFSAKGFAQLRFLQLSYLENFEEWRVEDGAMPNLKHLLIRHCGVLKMLPNEIQKVRSLQNIELFGMSKALVKNVKENEDWNKSVIFFDD